MGHKSDRSARSNTTAHRDGFTLAAVLVCLFVVLMFSGVLMKTLMVRRRVARSSEQQLQCMFLMQSAVERAKVRAALEPDYRGETWSVDCGDSEAAPKAVALISVNPVENEPRLRRVQVEARWPDHPTLRIRRTKELTITLPLSGAAS